MPGIADHVEKEGPAIKLAVDGAFFADRRDDVVENIFWNVVVPRLDDIGLDHRRHLDERRLANINVPGAFLVLGLGDETLDAESFHRRDLIVDAREFCVDGRNAGMKILDPLVEGGCQRPVLGKCRSDAALCDRPYPGEAKSGHQAAREEFAPVDGAPQKLLARRFLQDMLLFLAICHRLHSLG